MEATFVAEKLTNLLVGCHHRWSTRDKLHDTVHKSYLKTLFEEDFPHKLPVYVVIGFFENQLKKDSLFFGALDLVDYFLQDNGALQDVTTLKKHGLAFVDNTLGYRKQLCRVSFGAKFKRHVDQHNTMEE